MVYHIGIYFHIPMAKRSASSRRAAHDAKKPAPITTADFDRRFDAGEDISDYLDFSMARRPNRQRVNVDFPPTLLAAIDAEVERLGIARQEWIRTQLARAIAREREARQ
jgi:predicted DNA binding CopG/RHH family protein